MVCLQGNEAIERWAIGPPMVRSRGIRRIHGSGDKDDARRISWCERTPVPPVVTGGGRLSHPRGEKGEIVSSSWKTQLEGADGVKVC